MIRALTIGSLFSGYGGIELGLEQLGMFKTIWHCEIEPYPSAVLAEHWPGVPNLGDITKVEWTKVERPDVLVGGFPCQDVSMSGKRKGLKHDTRTGLWYAFAKAIRVLRPRFVIGENVAGLLVPKRERNRVEQAALGVVLAQLSSLGYDAEWQVISAAELGAPHRRDRVFIVAWRRGDGTDNFADPAVCGAETKDASYAEGARYGRRPSANGDDGRRWLSEQEAQEQSVVRCEAEGCCPSDADPSQCGCCEPQTNADAHREFREYADGRSEAPTDTFKERFKTDRTNRQCQPCAHAGTPKTGCDGATNYWGEWTLEPPICQLDDGPTARMDRYFWREQIKALGNGVVPQCAKEAARRMILPRL